jgi:hypothetical protein
MKLEPNFVTDVIRILRGRVPDPAEAALRAKCLDSVEEFLAWNLMRQDFGTTEPEIAKCIVELAHANVGKAETPRKESGFDLETRKALEELRIALAGVIKADENTCQDNKKAFNAMLRFAAAKDPEEDLLRFAIDIKN